MFLNTYFMKWWIIECKLCIVIKLSRYNYHMWSSCIKYYQSFMVDSGSTLQYSPFAVFVWPSPLLMCVTYPVFYPTGYDCCLYSLIPQRARVHSRWSLLYPGTYSHTWVFCVVLSVTFIPGFVMVMDKWYLIDGWLFPSFLILSTRI